MLRLRSRLSQQWLFLAVLTIVGSAFLGLEPRAICADLEQVNGSLKLIPANASFYSSMLRNGEQLDAIAKSRAWAKLSALPVMQLARAQLRQPPPQIAMFLQVLQTPENQQLLELLGEMVSDEVFFYGGPNCTKFTDLLMQAFGSLRYAPALAQLKGQGADPTRAQIAAVLQILAQNPDLLKTPDLAIGFKLRNKQPAEAQLKRLETLLHDWTEESPLLKGRFKRLKTGQSDLLVLSLDGSLAPWQQIPFKDYEEKDGQFDDLVKKLKGMKLTLSLGIQGDYLLFGIGETSEILALRPGDKRLIDRAELKPLAAHAGKRLTSVSYTSKEMRSTAGTMAGSLDSLVGIATEVMKQVNLTNAQRDRLHRDLDTIAKDIKDSVAEPGALVAFSFLNGRGIESYSYDWSGPGKGTTAKPLTLQNHVGGSPLMAFISRREGYVDSYLGLTSWLKIAYRDFEEIVLPKLDADARQKYEEIAKPLLPLVQRLDKVTRTLLLPALGDGEGAFVLDGKLKSTQWFAPMPASNQPLPILEPAFVWTVKDAPLLQQAVKEYRSIVNDLMTKLHELSPQVPDFQIPPPETRALTVGKLYYYPIPEQLGLDAQLLPNAGLSDKLAVLSISQDHTERLLGEKPLQVEGGPLADPAASRISASYVHWEGMVDTILPWVRYGLTLTKARAGGEGADGAPAWVGMLDQVPVALEVLKVFRISSSSTTVEDKVLVTHSETVIRDL